MKKVLSFVVTVVVVIAVRQFIGMGGGGASAIKYNDGIVGYQNKIIEKMLDLSNTFEKGTQVQMDAKLKALQAQIVESLAGVSKMEAFKGNTRLRDAAIALFKFYQSIAENEYREIIDILSKDPASISDSDKNRLVEIQNDITTRELGFDNEFQAAQKEFSRIHNFKMEENKYQKQIDGK
jgi:hypothetical protein